MLNSPCLLETDTRPDPKFGFRHCCRAVAHIANLPAFCDLRAKCARYRYPCSRLDYSRVFVALSCLLCRRSHPETRRRHQYHYFHRLPRLVPFFRALSLRFILAGSVSVSPLVLVSSGCRRCRLSVILLSLVALASDTSCTQYNTMDGWNSTLLSDAQTLGVARNST